MWKAVLEKPKNEQQQAIHQIFYSKIHTLPQIIKELQESYNQVEQTIISNWKFMLHIIFNHLTTQHCILYMKNQTNIFIKIINEIHKKVKREELLNQFSKFYQKYNIIQKNLVILKFLSQYYFEEASEYELTWLLPDFIKTSASIIQKFLKLKSQAPKFQTDYIQHGSTLTQHTQNWVKDCYIKMLSKLPRLKNAKYEILVCLSDMLGALLDLQQQKLIIKQTIDQILISIVSYCKLNFSIDKINNFYIKSLVKSNFWIKVSKIFISDVYTDQKILNKQGYAYLMYSYIKFMYQTQIFQKEKIQQYIIPALNQLSPFQYSFKQELISLLKSLQTSLQNSNFPISLFAFNLFLFADKNKEIKDIIKKNFISQNLSTVINSLIFLQSIPIQNRQKQKQDFILSILQEVQVCESHIILLKKINFQTVLNQSQLQRWINIVKKVTQKCSAKAKLTLKKALEHKQNKQSKKIIQLLQ